MDFAHFLPPLLTTLLASLVECIEAMTVVLAVGAELGRRGALIGMALALACLLVMVAVLGPALAALPTRAIHLGVGVLLLVFGLRWLRKAVLRAAGLIAPRVETAAGAHHRRHRTLVSEPTLAALIPAFQVVLVEGIEVVFIVLAVGSADRALLLPASVGAITALCFVMGLGVALHRPLARVPENALKFVVGVLTCAFGLFWMGEGLGLRWPGGDWAVLAIAALIMLSAWIAVRWLAHPRPARLRPRR